MTAIYSPGRQASFLSNIGQTSIHPPSKQSVRPTTARSPDRTNYLMQNILFRKQPAWDSIISTIEEWTSRPAEPDLDKGACSRALAYALLLAEDGEAVPSSIGITNNHGIAFEWRSGNDLLHIEIFDNKNAELTEFAGGRLVADSDLKWNSRLQAFVAID